MNALPFLAEIFDKYGKVMSLIVSDASPQPELSAMLAAYDCPAILVSADYQILAVNAEYSKQFGEIELAQQPKCFQVSHGYTAPCDQSGEDCPLSAATASGQKERVLHVHQTPRGREHVDVEMLPIFDVDGELLYFVELLRSVATTGGSCVGGTLAGSSAAFNRMLSRISRVSITDASVLLLGESGSGKELAARAIHCGSDREQGSLVTLECAGLTDSLFESELFGHAKGAFTGANVNRVGLVAEADGGTLFLDEIGDVPLSMQVKLLRLLETGTYRPVGSSTVKHSNFRLVCATHKNIAAMVANGQFREDLYYRINVFPIRIPALRERLEDLPALTETLLRDLRPSKEYHFTESAMGVLRRHRFSGNIRELRNILNRVVVLSASNLVDEQLIRECLDFDVGAGSEDARGDAVQVKPPWVDLKTAERQYLERLMQAFDHDKERVAEVAGISLRSLYRKLEA